jgi:hypothetical protein
VCPSFLQRGVTLVAGDPGQRADRQAGFQTDGLWVFDCPWRRAAVALVDQLLQVGAQDTDASPDPQGRQELSAISPAPTIR